MNAASLASLGIVVVDGFVDRAACRRLARGMDASPRGAARLGGRIDPARKALSVAAPDVTRELETRLWRERSRLERAFGVRFGHLESELLEYRRGDGFVQHIDRHSTTGAQRLVSTVVLLNAGYRGGRLLLYGLLGKDPPWDACGVPVDAAAGTLVAFPSQTVHEIEPVTSGRRLAIAAWFS